MFKLPRVAPGAGSVELRASELAMLLDGVDMAKLKRVPRYETRTEWHRVYAWRNLSKFARTLQKGQLVTLEGILRYREVEDEVKGIVFKHRIAEIHAISMKRLSKIEATDDPSD